MTLKELLATADEDSLRRWNNLALGYTESQGLPELREEIASMYTTVHADDVVVLVPEEGIYLSMLALLRPGDHVIVTYPGYQSLFEVARSIGCIIDKWEPTPTETGLRFEVDTLKGLVKPNTRLVVANFPHNPTGAMPSPEEWKEVVGLAAESGAYLFSDEMYRGLELDEESRLPSGVDVYDKAITLCGLSKTYALPGLRLGWLATRCPEAMKRVLELKDYTTICSPATSEVLSLMALRMRDQLAERNMTLIRTNLDYLDRFFAEHPDKFKWHRPQGSSTAFPELVNGQSAAEFCQRLVDESGILLMPASTYDYEPDDGRQHFRIGFGRKNMTQVVDLLAANLSQEN